MRQVKCEMCSVEFETNARNCKRCEPCREEWNRQYHYDYHRANYKKKGYNGFGENNNNWKNGLGRLKSWWGKEIKAERRYCQICKKDLKDANRWLWCIHHVDRDQTNNVIENLMLLCKRCHQIEHECYKNLEGATTIPSGSKVQEDLKRETP